MSHTFKFTGYKSQATMLLTNCLYNLKYRIPHDRWKDTLDLASRWKQEQHYPFRESLNEELQRICSEKYNCKPPHTIDITNRRIWIAVPYNDRGRIFGIQITWKEPNTFTFFASVEEDVWKVHYTRLLFKICYDLKNAIQPVEINGQRLKVGEWLAALLFDLSGDSLGMLATLDEAEDRK